MAKNRFLKNISANTLQLITNQVFGLAIFYALSKGLDKAIFGEINWALAVLLTSFAILSFGIDQLMVKKIASGDMQIFSAYSFHVLIAGSLFYALMLLCSFLVPNQSIILFIGIGKLMIFLSGPFKQLATGREKFGELFFMSVASNVVRGSALLVLLLSHQMTLQNSLLVFILGDLAELVLCRIIAGRISGGLKQT